MSIDFSGIGTLISLFLAASVINNFVLTRFLGLCPFFGVSKRLKPALSMGMAVTFVNTTASIISWLLNTQILERYELTFLRTTAFILVIAFLVQLIEIFLKKYNRTMYEAFGIYLPLITTNCIVLGVVLLNVSKQYSLVQSTVFGFGSGVGFALALIIMSGIRERLELADVPESLKGVPIAMIIAGLLAMAFSGFSGM